MLSKVKALVGKLKASGNEKIQAFCGKETQEVPEAKKAPARKVTKAATKKATKK